MKTPTTRNATVGGSEETRRRNGRGFARWRKLIPWLVLAGLVAAIASGLRPKPVLIELAVVSRAPLVVTVLEEGKTRIRHRYVVSAPIGGFLRRVEHRPGAPIEAGKTVLAVIEPPPASLLDPRTRAEAEARVHAAEAAKLSSEAEVERARAAFELAEKDAARADALNRTGAISAREWDAAQNQVTVLARALRAAEFSEQVARFKLSEAQAVLSQAQNTGEDSAEPLKLVAPTSGFVLTVFEENARFVASGTAIMEVGDPRDLEAEIELLSSDAVGVQPGAEVTIEQWGGGKPLRGRVSVVEPGGFTKISALGVEEQRVKVRVDFLDPIPAEYTLGDRFRVEARIVTWRGEDVLQVPTGALFRRGSDWMVFANAHGRAQLRKVEIGRNNGVAAEVRDGVSAGTQVILHPPDDVTDGARIRERKA